MNFVFGVLNFKNGFCLYIIKNILLYIFKFLFLHFKYFFFILKLLNST